MWRKDKEGRDKLLTLKGSTEVAAADNSAAIVERLVSQLVVNAQTYKVPWVGFYVCCFQFCWLQFLS